MSDAWESLRYKVRSGATTKVIGTCEYDRRQQSARKPRLWSWAIELEAQETVEAQMDHSSAQDVPSTPRPGCRLEPIGRLRIGLDGAERIARASGDDRNLKFVAVLEADTADGSNPTGNRSPYATIDRTPCR